MNLGVNISNNCVYFFAKEKLHDNSMVDHHILVKIEYPILDILFWNLTADIKERLK